MDRFKLLQSFVQIIDSNGISSAAQELNLAKSAVSRQLKELEAHLGTELLYRTTRQMTLTETGRTFYQHAVELLNDLAEAEQVAALSNEHLTGSLKIALPSNFGELHMGDVISRFAQQYPDIHFDIDFNDRNVDLVREGFDLAIRIANLQDSSLVARSLIPIKIGLYASPSYVARRGLPQQPRALVKHDCLVYTLVNNYEQWRFTDQNVSIKPYMKASSGIFLKACAEQGLGIAQLPNFIAYQAIMKGNLIPILPQHEVKSFTAYAIYPPMRHMPKRVRVFIDYLANYFKKTPTWG